MTRKLSSFPGSKIHIGRAGFRGAALGETLRFKVGAADPDRNETLRFAARDLAALARLVAADPRTARAALGRCRGLRETLHDTVVALSEGRAVPAAVLAVAGHKDMRFALPNSSIMVHQPSGGARGMASDIQIQANEILRIRKRMNDLYAKYTGKPLKDIEKAMDRDTFLEAEEAKAFGIVDQVFDKRPANTEAEAG